MDNRPIRDQLRDCAVSLLDFDDKYDFTYKYLVDPLEIIIDAEHYHVGYDAENDCPIYCCMADLVAGDDDVRCYFVRHGKYVPLRLEFLSQSIRPFNVWGVICNNVFPVETDPCINYENSYVEKFAELFRDYYTGSYKPGSIVKVNRESYLSKLNDWFYDKIGIIKGMFLATVTDTDGHECSLLCAHLSALPQWSAYAAQSIDCVECKDILVPLHYLEPARAEKNTDAVDHICRNCKHWDENNKDTLLGKDPFFGKRCKCMFHSPFRTNNTCAQYRNWDDFCNAWEARE